MGNHLETAPHSPYDTSLLTQLRQKTLSEISECTTVIVEDYPEFQSIDYSQFEDIFGVLVDDPEPFFLLLQNEGNIDGVIDIYEALAMFVFFCKDKLDDKVKFIFGMFDFDNNSSLEIAELTLTLQAALRGVCKFVHITPPCRQSFAEETTKIFSEIDRDQSARISLGEFFTWVKCNREIQRFLLKYAGILTQENLRSKYMEIYGEYLQLLYNNLDTRLPEYADAKGLKKAIEVKEKGLVKQSDIDFLLDILKNTTSLLLQGAGQELVGENLISKEAYDAVIKGWCCFATSDLNRDNSLVSSELYGLLWLYEDKEPNDERVKFEMDGMNKTRQDHITLNDWMKNLCMVDEQGKCAIRPSMKKLFDKYDLDGSGHLNVEEVKKVFEEMFQGYVKRAGCDRQKDIADTVNGLTIEVFRELDGDGSRTVGWNEFKKFTEISWGKIAKLRSFLDKNVD